MKNVIWLEVALAGLLTQVYATCTRLNMTQTIMNTNLSHSQNLKRKYEIQVDT